MGWSDLAREVAVVIPDTHVPLQDDAACAAVHRLIRYVRPTTVVHLGDLGEWDAASNWKFKNRAKPPLEYQLRDLDLDYEAVNAWLDELDATCKAVGVGNKILIEGNHEVWIRNITDAHPYLIGYSVQERLRLFNRGWQWVQEGAQCNLYGVRLHHGHAGPGGVAHARNHCLRWGVDVIYGHTHDVSAYSLGQANGAVTANSLGCLKRLDAQANPWLRGAPTGWAHACGILTKNRGQTHLEVCRIHNGVVVIGGREV